MQAIKTCVKYRDIPRYSYEGQTNKRVAIISDQPEIRLCGTHLTKYVIFQVLSSVLFTFAINESHMIKMKPVSDCV